MTKTIGIIVLGIVLTTPALKGQISAKQVFEDVRIEQKLNDQIPLDLTFNDAQGNRVRLGDYFHDKPVILSLVYYECPMLCTQVLNGMVGSFKILRLSMGKEYDVVTVSIDPRETPELAAQKKAQYLKTYARKGSENGWHFLTGDQESIHKLAEAVGFHYVYDKETGQFAHASAIMVATPEGKLARYFYGIEYPAVDLRLAIVEASANKIGTVTDQLLLLCYHYDPATGKYGLVLTNIMRLGGILTVLAIGGFIVIMVRRERKNRHATGEQLATSERTPS